MDMENVTTALQDDAMSNLWQIYFPQGIPGFSGKVELLTLRADQSFDIPNDTLAKYDIEFQGIKIPKTSSKEDTTKEFTLSFRVDVNWEVYNALRVWWLQSFDPVTGIYFGEAETRRDLIIRNFGPGITRPTKKQIKFNGTKIFDLKTGTFDHTSEQPVRCEAQFIYAYKTEEI